MKKTLFSLLSATALLWSTSCSEEAIAPSVGEEAAVQFNVQLSDGSSASRAISDGTTVNKLYYEVWGTQNGELVEMEELKSSTKVVGKQAYVSLSLVKSQTYKIVFWAQYEDENGEGHYNTSDLTAIDVTPGYANDETRDAFTEVYEFTVNGAKDHTVTLTRPFAQVNFGTSDLELAENAGLELSTSKIVVKKAATKYNALTEEGSDEADLTFDYKEISNLAEGLKVSNVDYTYLANAYVLVEGGIADKNLATVELTVATNMNESIVIEVANAPLQRNYRTNVIGSLLTDQNDFTVVVDADFEEDREDHIIEVWDGVTVEEPEIEVNDEGEPEAVISTGSQLAWLAAAVNGTLPATFQSRAGNIQEMNIKLTSNIDLGNNPWTPIGFNPNDVAGNENYFTGTFDGNGHTISNLFVDVKDQGGVGLFGAVYKATFKNFTLANVNIKAVESESDPANTSGAQGKKEYIACGHIGAVAGYDAKAGDIIFENVHVEGLIKIEGETRAAQGQRIGGIFGGRNSSNVSFKNVSVKGSEGSYIKGYCSTAGVVGQAQGVTIFENVHTDINVYAVTFGAGGISGIAIQGSTFTNCSSAGNITLDASKTQLSSYSANYPYRVGGIAGCWSESKTGVLTLSGCSYTGTLTSIDKDGNSPESFDYAGFVGRGYTLKNCAGSTVDVNGTKYVQAYDDVYGLYTVNGEYQIGTAAALKSFAAKVNAGDTFIGKTVKLIADIDLKNENWAPIGTIDNNFEGNFDGNGCTVKNLNISEPALDSDGYAYAGLFGVTAGSEVAPNSIKNVVLENVKISTTGHIVAAAVAYPYYTKIEDVTVEGDVNVMGGDYTAGILAYTRRCVDAKNLAIKANTGSVIEGRITVGGVISDIQMNGGLTANYSNFEASGLTIKATKNVGGISGIISKQTLNGAIVKNVNIVCDDERKGIVSGATGGKSTINNVSYENVTGATRIIGATYDKGYYEGQIVDVAGVKAIVYSIEDGAKAVSVEELNLKGKSAVDAATWAQGLGEGWNLASIYELDAIHAARKALNVVLAADNAENALFCETDYITEGKYAMYISSTVAEGNDSQGQAYFANRVHVKYFNLNGYWDYPYSTFATINKSAPLKDNYFARGVIAL